MRSPRDQHRKQKRQRDQVIAKALRNRDETREKLLAQGRQLARRRAKNIERNQKHADSASNSLNASVHSTMPSMDANVQAAARHSHSTVPTRPKGSSVPAADRLYGLRLYKQIQPDTDASEQTPTADNESTTPADMNSESDTKAPPNGGDR